MPYSTVGKLWWYKNIRPYISLGLHYSLSIVFPIIFSLKEALLHFSLPSSGGRPLIAVIWRNGGSNCPVKCRNAKQTKQRLCSFLFKARWRKTCSQNNVTYLDLLALQPLKVFRDCKVDRTLFLTELRCSGLSYCIWICIKCTQYQLDLVFHSSYVRPEDRLNLAAQVRLRDWSALWGIRRTQTWPRYWILREHYNIWQKQTLA